MTAAKHISQIKEGTQFTPNSDDYSAYAGTPQEEELVVKAAIKEFRKSRFEAFKKEQYHTNYIKFADDKKEQRLLKPENITACRHNKFTLFCKETTETDYLAFAGLPKEEKQVGLSAIIYFRKQKEIQDKTKKYWEKVNTPQTISYKKYTTDEFFNYITTERADNVFGYHKIGPLSGKSKFKLDDQAKAIITPLCEYFTNNPKFEERFFVDPDTNEKIMFSLEKGILLFSECGFGKTDTMRIFTANPKQSFKVVNCLTTEEDFSIDGDDGIRKYYTCPINPNPHLFFGHTKFGTLFDNLGLEKQGKYYGSPEEVMEKILFQIYHRKTETMGKIHLTTNFSRQYIKDRYGPAIYSRFFEMFNFLTFPANSVDRRKNHI